MKSYLKKGFAIIVIVYMFGSLNGCGSSSEVENSNPPAPTGGTGNPGPDLSLPITQGGVVIDLGQEIDNAVVTFKTCNNKEFTVRTGINGVFSFNPYSTTTESIDQAVIIPAGKVQILVQKAGATGTLWRVSLANHQYNEQCKAFYNNEEKTFSCKKYSLTLPAQPPQQGLDVTKLGELQRDFEDFCR